MLKKKRYLYLDEAEYSILVKSLVQMKNKLIQQKEWNNFLSSIRKFRLSNIVYE